jgi:hypothetical protein
MDPLLAMLCELLAAAKQLCNWQLGILVANV